MMTTMNIKNTIIEELELRGYEVAECTKIDNGVELAGIRIINDSNFQPIFYIDRLVEDIIENSRSIYQVVNRIIDIVENSQPNVNINEISKPEFIINNVYVGIQKKSNDDTVKRDCFFDNTESYLYVKCSEDGSFKLKTELFKQLKISEEELWNKAMEHTRATATIKSLSSIVGDIMGEEVKGGENINLYVLTNKDNFRGSACILDPIIRRRIKTYFKTNQILILPSSIHELIIKPIYDNEEIDIGYMEKMIREVNEGYVDETEQLGDRPYILKL